MRPPGESVAPGAPIIPARTDRAGRDGTASDSFDHRGDSLAAADAHRDEAITLAGAMQFVHALDRQDAAGRADRVAERHCAAVRIDFRRIEPELLADAERLRGERL